MNGRENTMTIRTVGLYLVLSGLLIGIFTASLLVAKHGQGSQAATTNESEQRDDGRYKLAVAPTELEQDSTAALGGANNLEGSASASAATIQPGAPEQTPSDSPAMPAAQQPSAPPRVAPSPSAPQQIAPQAVSPPAPAAVASAPPEQPSLLGNLLGGVLGILTLR